MKTKNYAIMIILYVKYALSLHMVSCMWIFFGRLSMNDHGTLLNMTDGWILRNSYIYDNYTMFEIYVDALAIMTETISKVGYGMPYAPLNTLEMIYIILVIFFSFDALTMIFFQMNDLHIPQPVIEYVKTHHNEMEKYISKIESMSF